MKYYIYIYSEREKYGFQREIEAKDKAEALELFELDVKKQYNIDLNIK